MNDTKDEGVSMKILVTAFFLFVILAPEIFGQTDTSLLRLNDYAEFFGF